MLATLKPATRVSLQIIPGHVRTLRIIRTMNLHCSQACWFHVPEHHETIFLHASLENTLRSSEFDAFSPQS